MTGARGQTVVEYIVLIGIVTAALFFMGPLFKRGVQSLVKVTGDQIGNQLNADQDVVARDYNNPVEGVSFLNSSLTDVQAGVNRTTRKGVYGRVNGQIQDLGYTEIGVNESTDTTADTVTDLGYTPRQ